MGWNAGTYTKGNNATGGWTGDASLGIGIEAGRHDTQDNDFATGINNCIAKDGQNAATADLPMGGFKHTNVANATARNNYAAVGQVQDGSLIYGATSGGSANAQTLTLAPAITAYAAGQEFNFIAGFTNTGATTLNVNGVAAKSIFNAATGAAIGAGEIVSGRVYKVIYDGTQFVLINDVTPIQNGDYIWLGTTGGTATAQTATATPAITAYKAGQKFRMKIGAGLGSTGSVVTAHTLNVNSLGAKNIVNNGDSTNPTLGTWIAGAIMEVIYDGTNFVITNDPGGWLTWSPTLAVDAGSLSSVVNYINMYRKIGKAVHVITNNTFTTNSVTGYFVYLPLPINASEINQFFACATNRGGGKPSLAYIADVGRIAHYSDFAGTAWGSTAGCSINYQFTYRSV